MRNSDLTPETQKLLGELSEALGVSPVLIKEVLLRWAIMEFGDILLKPTAKDSSFANTTIAALWKRSRNRAEAIRLSLRRSRSRSAQLS